MEKTSNYNLNKPEAGDPLRLADFNQNADILDAALNNLNAALGGKAEQSALAAVQAMATTERIRMGSYTGDGTSGKRLELGFTPKIILLMSQWNSGAAICIATEDYAYYAFEDERNACATRIVENGVQIDGNLNNGNNYLNHYIAFL